MSKALVEVKTVNGIKISYCALLEKYVVIMPKTKDTCTLEKFATVELAEDFITENTGKKYWWEEHY